MKSSIRKTTFNFTNTKMLKIHIHLKKNIAIHKEGLDVWKEKLKQLRNLNQD
jgi:hypothetical protein